MSIYEQIQDQLDRLTGGRVQVTTKTTTGATVTIGDGQGGGEYHSKGALTTLRAIASEGDDDRDALWSALETCAVTTDTTETQEYTLRDEGGHEEEILAEDLDDATKQAHEWASGGDYGEVGSATIWITTTVHGPDGGVHLVTTAINPEEPDCTDDGGHDWQQPHELVGGIEDNPGVFGSGGGVLIVYACLRCGAERRVDTWAQNPETGEQGLESITYAEGVYDTAAADDEHDHSGDCDSCDATDVGLTCVMDHASAEPTQDHLYVCDRCYDALD